jgi:hypothetical protein
MHELKPSQLHYTGQSIENHITHLNPNLDLTVFLQDAIGLSLKDSDRIADEVRSSKVVIAQSDAMSLNFPNVPAHDDSVPRIVDAVMPSPDKIVIRSGLVRIFQKTLEHQSPGIVHLSPEQIRDAATNTAVIYQLGDFVCRKVFQLISDNVEGTALPVPPSISEAKGLFTAVLNDLQARDPHDTIGDYDPSTEAIANYYRTTRPERFSAFGGWLLVNMTDQRINPDPFIHELKSYHFNLMTDGNVFQPQDIGSLYPLEPQQFSILCSFVQGTDKVTPIDCFK